MKPPRSSWHDLPDAFIHAPESAVKKHPHYAAAKSGDAAAAEALLADTFNPTVARTLATVVGAEPPILLSAHAYEKEGVNAIPEAFANSLGRLLGWPVDAGIVQSNVVAHTGADGFSRLARPAEFEGAVAPGAAYVLVDDFVGMGGTLANLKGYVETQGGRVVAATALTGKPFSAKLAVSPERLRELRAKHGNDLESWWHHKFGHAFDALTESEARYLTRTADVDTIRNRLAAAEQAGDRSKGS